MRVPRWSTAPTLAVAATTGRGTWVTKQRLIAATTIVAVLYNALLAIFAARGGPASYAGAVVCEVTIISIALGISVSDGISRKDTVPLGYLLFTVGITLVISFAAERAFVDSLRNVLIIVAFTLLGARATLSTVRATFLAIITIALIILLIEITSLQTYAWLFRPGEYLAKTRGYTQPEFYQDVGLTKGTIAYSRRFTFGLFDGPRTSTIFLEQVGINCFAIVVMIYLMALYPVLSAWERIIAIATLLLILVTNNARMASLLVPVYIVAYLVAPRLPRWPLLVMPFVLLAAVWTIFQFETVERSDNLVGRLAITYQALADLTVSDMLLGNVRLTWRRFDTGYGYTIIAATLFGALAYWAYISLVVPYRDWMQRRAAWGLAIYIYLWLLVGGTGSFSMKTASLLWLLIGYVRMRSAEDGEIRNAAHEGLGSSNASSSARRRPSLARPVPTSEQTRW